jgi:hypothetical protein
MSRKYFYNYFRLLHTHSHTPALSPSLPRSQNRIVPHIATRKFHILVYYTFTNSFGGGRPRVGLHSRNTYNLHSRDALFEFRPGNGLPQFVLLLNPFGRMSTHLIRHCVISATESLHVFTDETVVSRWELGLLIENQHSFLGISILNMRVERSSSASGPVIHSVEGKHMKPGHR